MDAIINFSIIFYRLFFEMAFYLLLGLGFVGLLYILFTKEHIVKYLGANSFGSIVKASILGVPLPLCSCGVVPTTVFMANNGASRGAVVSFLVSTPQTGIDSIFATYGMMGPIFAFFRPFSALIMGMFAGSTVHFFSATQDKEITSTGTIDSPTSCNSDSINSSCTSQSQTTATKQESKLIRALKYSFVEFLDDISPQFIVGLFIASLITYFIPTDYFAGTQFSSGILGMLLMIIIGIPMYICATASIPVAISLILKGFSPGVAFVFLAVGPATNAATISILIKSLGKKVVSIYLLSLIFSSIIFGYIIELFYSLSGIDPKSSLVISDNCHAADMSISEMAFGIIFLILILMSLYRIYLKKYFTKEITMQNLVTLKVQGMNCNHCSNSVRQGIESIDGVENINVDLSKGEATFTTVTDVQVIINKINSLGYLAELK